MKKLSELTGVRWDGVAQPYVPGPDLRVDPSLRLHCGNDAEVDPVTFEVIRHALWNTNEEHGSTIQRISGSPVAVYAVDLNPSILTEDGEFVYIGPYMQYMSGFSDLQVKWTLENRSANPGIRDGDMFIANDPWIGGAHQSDVILLCPVFHDGALFCWITNCLHQYDVGGVTPGSFCIPARDVFDEGLMLPPTKIVERGELKADVEALYVRASRRPDMVALDLRAQVAGNAAAKTRIEALIARYGADIVKGVMRRVIANGEAAFVEKMRSLPDGTWQERTYVECAFIGDRRIYPVVTRVRKEGSSLTFENGGTAPQMGGMNATYSGWRGSVMVALNQVLCWDQSFAIGGALRHVRFDPTPGTFTCANYPASVSTAPVQAMEIALYPTYTVLSKMVHLREDLRPDIICMSGSSQMPLTQYRGIDQHGQPFGYAMIDILAGAIGAFAVGDGISTGGQSRTPISKIPNVEFTEHQFPLLYLYRKEVPDSGGAGRWRGGMSGVSAWVPHHVEGITHELLSSGMAVPSSLGMMGGRPSTTNHLDFVRGSDVQERLAGSRLIGDIDELFGERVVLRPREAAFEQTRNDAFAITWCGGGGFGDPLRRDVASVARDLEDRTITPEGAADQYGAVVAGGRVDPAATEKRRAELRRERLERATGGRKRRRQGEELGLVSAGVALRRDRAGVFYGCGACDAELASIGESYKDGCAIRTMPIEKSNQLIRNPALHVDEQVSFREFLCPCCGELLEAEVVVGEAAPMPDILLEPNSVSELASLQTVAAQ